MVTSVGGEAHERLAHEAGNEILLTTYLCTNLSVGGQAIAGAQGIVEGKVQFQLTRGIFVITLDHVQTHGPGILDHLHHDRFEGLKLVDVVAIRFAETARGLAVRSLLQPHHFGLGTVAQVETVMIALELSVDSLQVASAI